MKIGFNNAVANIETTCNLINSTEKEFIAALKAQKDTLLVQLHHLEKLQNLKLELEVRKVIYIALD